MLLTAKISKRYLQWLGMVAAFCIGIPLWFLYDGAIAYPKQRVRAHEYEKLKEEDRLDEWETIAADHGWPTKDPGEPKNSVPQYVLAALLAPPGLWCLCSLLRFRKRWIELNETGLRTNSGRQLEFGQIITLNKKKWKSKGIAIIRYQRDGRKKRLVLDDWKYDSDETRAILREIEARIDVQQIVAGPPESSPQEGPEEADSSTQE
jgi:hypothetical protein